LSGATSISWQQEEREGRLTTHNLPSEGINIRLLIPSIANVKFSAISGHLLIVFLNREAMIYRPIFWRLTNFFSYEKLGLYMITAIHLFSGFT
jgi:hypothetical protein